MSGDWKKLENACLQLFPSQCDSQSQDVWFFHGKQDWLQCAQHFDYHNKAQEA